MSIHRVVKRAFAFGLFVVLAGADARALGSHHPAAPDPWLMGVLGDSIAAGSLADVPIPYAPTPEESVRQWHDQGVESQFIYTNKRTLSWGSGTKIQSHFVLLAEWLKSSGDAHPLAVANVSHPGDETGDLPNQVEKLLQVLRDGKFAGLKYVALNIGSNDACNSSSVDEVPEDQIHRNVLDALSHLAKGVRSILNQREPIRVLLVGAPRIPDLGTPDFAQAKTLFGLSCTTVRDVILRYCRPLTLWNGLQEYLQRIKVVETVNRILKSVALEVSSEFPDLQVIYSDRMFQMEIPLGALAVDCFHPGKWAQEQISKQSWKDQPWFH